MIIIPAIDIKDGRCVRLRQGRMADETIFSEDPVAVAARWVEEGAKRIHLVDLDGAKNPYNRQVDLIAKIISSTGLKVQTGGGIRSFADVQALVDAGASRIVIGSLAVRDPEATKAIFKAFGPEKICLAADVIWQNNGFYIAVSGWQEASSLSLFDFIETYQQDGLLHALCTDIDRDGTLTGCNRDLYQEVKRKYPKLQLQASGGVSMLADLDGLAADGVIIGKALYEGRFTVAQALEAVAC